MNRSENMKKFGRILLTGAMLLALAGCGQEKTEGGSTAAPAATTAKEAVKTTEASSSSEADTTAVDDSVWYFKKGDVRIEVGAKATPVVEALKDSLMETNEFPSCAFDGMDKYYKYPGFELYAYQENGKDVITQLVLRDDTVSTPEGIYIGSSRADVDKAYSSAENASSFPNNYSFTKGNSTLLILLEDEVVKSIQYSLVTEE